MLANGATLGYKKKTGSPSTYTDLPGLKEIPEMGIEAEKVENSGLTDGHKMYELGVGDLPDIPEAVGLLSKTVRKRTGDV